uniref:Exostosin GT47 domain-containing protein n=1 Tax=viral metagenome TaxID=1070528 RepID=A0A6C0JNA1_9ZZZZ
MSNIIITGEKIQQLCDIYLGDLEDFNYNPVIHNQKEKHVYLDNINNSFNNPFYIFCYSHKIILLSKKIEFFQNDFVLVTHNSDFDIKETNEVINILNCNKLLKWYAQNLCISKPKLELMPIGFANSQWQHGNLYIFNDPEFIKKLSIKTNRVYFNFSIITNKIKRQICYDSLIDKIKWLNTIHPIDNLKRLSSYEFCICPEGNGVDTHRLWECLYLSVVPIVIKSEFTDILLKYNIPLYVLDNWSDFDINKINYNNFNFNNDALIKLLTFTNSLINI